MILYMSIFCRVVRKWCYLSLILYFSASLRGSGASFELGLVMAMRGLYALVYYSRGFRAANASTVGATAIVTLAVVWFSGVNVLKLI
jgi:hypothetical protein